jgi:hypothetical protein
MKQNNSFNIESKIRNSTYVEQNVRVWGASVSQQQS